MCMVIIVGSYIIVNFGYIIVNYKIPVIFLYIIFFPLYYSRPPSITFSLNVDPLVLVKLFFFPLASLQLDDGGLPHLTVWRIFPVA